MSANPNFVNTVNNYSTHFQWSDLDSDYNLPAKKAFEAGANGSWLRALNISSKSVRTMVVEVLMRPTATQAQAGQSREVVLGRALIPPGKVVNAMDPSVIPGMDPIPNRGLRLASGQAIWLRPIGSTEAWYRPASTPFSPTELNPSAATFSILKDRGRIYGFELHLPDGADYFKLFDGDNNEVFTRDGRFKFSTEVLRHKIPAANVDARERMEYDTTTEVANTTAIHISGYRAHLVGNMGVTATNVESVSISTGGEISVTSPSPSVLGQMKVYKIEEGLAPYTSQDRTTVITRENLVPAASECTYLGRTPLLHSEILNCTAFGGNF